MTENKTSIQPSTNGPYLAKDLNNLKNSKGDTFEPKPMVAMCRCGQSSTKPFCDGTHVKVGFTGEKLEGRQPDKVDDYVGKDITIHDNRGVCSHRGYCTDNLPSVFRMKQEPWIDPEGASVEDIMRVIEMCPSGALSYTKDGVLHKELDREPGVTISKDGPYEVVGGVELDDPDGNTPESKEHYTLCRCGASKNKPFCNGEHWYVEFKDEKN
ncbi:CDGSH iron-sulfur domain-containing protein [Methanococcoides sp. NM1]|uniref:CDGSH iron-sulfur domain-containing protein n=1 Tax=Methanococcoides sp. NM1 TaxID=1201013 RepID=UPI0010829821|nr:CDGSH iron-sulfur domain-containing protein [Methanococcoides sp. NM1]